MLEFGDDAEMEDAEEVEEEDKQENEEEEEVEAPAKADAVNKKANREMGGRSTSRKHQGWLVQIDNPKVWRNRH